MAQNCSQASFKWGKMGRGLYTAGFLGLLIRGVAGDATGWQTSSQGTMLLPNTPVSAGVTSNRELVIE